MSIEWLLTKTSSTQTQGKPPKNTHKEGGLSGTDHDSKSRELDQEKEDNGEQRLVRAEDLSSAKMENEFSEIDIRCKCGYTGTVSQSKTDFKLLRTGKNGLAYYECSNCRRHLRYNSSTGEIKLQKGILGILLGRFS